MKAKKEVKKSEEKAPRITLDIKPEDRAKGVKVPRGNYLVLSSKSDGSKLPDNLKAIWVKVEARGKDGIRIDTLAPKDPKTGKSYPRWLVRTLIKLGYLKVVDEPKPEKSKHLTIANAVKKSAKAKKSNTEGHKARKAA